jgi:hypothetical protein
MASAIRYVLGSAIGEDEEGRGYSTGETVSQTREISKCDRDTNARDNERHDDGERVSTEDGPNRYR